jgi:hypothetical protein
LRVIDLNIDRHPTDDFSPLSATEWFAAAEQPQIHSTARPPAAKFAAENQSDLRSE